MEPQLRNFCMFIKNWTFCTSACSPPSVLLLVATVSAIWTLALCSRGHTALRPLAAVTIAHAAADRCGQVLDSGQVARHLDLGVMRAKDTGIAGLQAVTR